MTVYCSQEAFEQNTPIYGTASEAAVWLMLEYAGEWTAKALDNNMLPAVAQRWLAKQTAAVPDSRAVFVKQSRHDAHHQLFIAVSKANDQRLYRFDLDSYDQLEHIDVQAVVSGIVTLEQSTKPLYLVCTNGKRDQCCSKFGLPVYTALKAAGVDTWQCTHLGGHRYAPVVGVFPAGILYGFVQPNELTQLQSGDLMLNRYRGRVYQSGVVNAADYFLRQHLNLTDAAAFDVITAETNHHAHHVVTFDNGYQVELAAAESEPVQVSCSPNKSKPQPIYQLVKLTPLR